MCVLVYLEVLRWLSCAAAISTFPSIRSFLSPQDFEQDEQLCSDAIHLAEDLVVSPVLVMAEHRAAARVLKQLKAIVKEEEGPDLAERCMVPVLVSADTQR